jgi:hypothetical protein
MKDPAPSRGGFSFSADRLDQLRPWRLLKPKFY